VKNVEGQGVREELRKVVIQAVTLTVKKYGVTGSEKGIKASSETGS
jgi:hypothetical protein